MFVFTISCNHHNMRGGVIQVKGALSLESVELSNVLVSTLKGSLQHLVFKSVVIFLGQAL